MPPRPSRDGLTAANLRVQARPDGPVSPEDLAHSAGHCSQWLPTILPIYVAKVACVESVRVTNPLPYSPPGAHRTDWDSDQELPEGQSRLHGI